MKKTTYTVTRFDIKDGFYVEVSPIIIDGNKMCEFFLCNENYGIKELMIGLHENECPSDIWEEIIESNVDFYIKAYIENNMN